MPVFSGSSIACISPSGYLMPQKNFGGCSRKLHCFFCLILVEVKNNAYALSTKRRVVDSLYTFSYLTAKCALNPKKGNIRQQPHLKCTENVNHAVWGRMSRSWRRDPVQQECWRFMEVHLDLNLLATSLWIGGLFNVSLKKNMGKAISGGFSHLETCWCLHVTSLPARGLPGCKEHCFQCATPRSWTKWAHEPKAALRPKGNPRTGLQVLQNGTKHLCCRTDSGKIREAISLSLQSSSISTGNTPVQHAVDACVVCMRLHGGPGLTVCLAFSSLVTNEMQQKNSWKGRCPVYNVPAPPTKDSKRTMDMRKPFAFFELQQVCCTGLLYKNRLKASNESKNGANVSNTTRESNVTGAVLPVPCPPTHRAFLDSFTFQWNFCRCHLACSGFKDKQRCIEWSSCTGFFNFLTRHTAIFNQAVLREEGTVCFEVKYHANGWRIGLFDSHLILAAARHNHDMAFKT